MDDKFQEMEKAMEERVRQLEARVESIDKRRDNNHSQHQSATRQFNRQNTFLPESGSYGMDMHVEAMESCLEEVLELMLPHVDAILSEMERRVSMFSSWTSTPIATASPAASQVKKNKSSKNAKRPLSGNFSSTSTAKTSPQMTPTKDTPPSPRIPTSTSTSTKKTPIIQASSSYSSERVSTDQDSHRDAVSTVATNQSSTADIDTSYTASQTVPSNFPIHRGSVSSRGTAAAAAVATKSPSLINFNMSSAFSDLSKRMITGQDSSRDDGRAAAAAHMNSSTANANMTSSNEHLTSISELPFFASFLHSMSTPLQPKLTDSALAAQRFASERNASLVVTTTSNTNFQRNVALSSLSNPSVSTTEVNAFASPVSTASVSSNSSKISKRVSFASNLNPPSTMPVASTVSNSAMTEQRLVNIRTSTSVGSPVTSTNSPTTVSASEFSNRGELTRETETIPTPAGMTSSAINSSISLSGSKQTASFTTSTANSLVGQRLANEGNSASVGSTETNTNSQRSSALANFGVSTTGIKTIPTVTGMNSISAHNSSVSRERSTDNQNQTFGLSTASGASSISNSTPPTLIVSPPTQITVTTTTVHPSTGIAGQFPPSSSLQLPPSRSSLVVDTGSSENLPAVSHELPSANDTDSSREHMIELLKNGSISGKLQDVRKALDAGVDVNLSDAHGQRALHWAAWCGHEDIVALLVRRGATLNVRNDLSLTPLHMAASSGTAQCIAFLLDAGVDINSRNKNQKTSLHLAASKGHEAAVHVLVAAGANKTLLDNEGRTAFELAKTDAIREVLIF